MLDEENGTYIPVQFHVSQKTYIGVLLINAFSSEVSAFIYVLFIKYSCSWWLTLSKLFDIHLIPAMLQYYKL